MTTELTEVNTKVQEVPAEPVAAPVVEPELVYEYQAQDDQGRPLGGKQVFKGKTWQEITEKVAESNKNLIKLSRELNRKVRLGEVEKDELPEGVVLTSNFDFKPRELSEEEVSQVTRELQDPVTARAAIEKIQEASLGAKPSVLRDRFLNQEQRLAMIEAKNEASAFTASNPDYYVCADNFTVMTNWMVKNSLAPIRQNFQLAFDRLKAAGLLLEAPNVREEVPVTAPVVDAPEPTQVAPQPPVQEVPSRITREEPAQPPRTVVSPPSGLTRHQASNAGAAPKGNALTLAEVESMPSEVYKRRLLTDPSFAKAVDELYAPKPKNA